MVSAKRLLIVDDDANIRTSLSELFRISGYAVMQVDSGAAAIELLSNFRPHVIILDYVMPDLDGAATASLIREQEPDLPIVFLTGITNTIALAAISHAVVLRKPAEVDTILDAVAAAINV